VRALVIAALLAGCGGKNPVDQICGQLATHCDLAAADVGACKTELAEAGVSGELAKKMVACGAEADSCPELLGCYAGAGAAELAGVLDEFREGFERGAGNPRNDSECEGFKRPTGDCTRTDRSCEWDSDCGDGMRCNKRVDRCFDPKGPCVGSPCSFDSDCAGGERCNDRTDTCFDTGASQHCMPCVFDSDCGATRCVGNTCAG
jgi:hypothetical protein